MKANLKKIGIIAINIVLVLSAFSSVQAIDDNSLTEMPTLSASAAENLANISMSAVNITGNEINKGEKFVLEIRVADITLGTGIAAVQGTFEYNEDVLEKVEHDEENALVNGWTRTFNPSNKKFLLDRETKTNQDQVIAKFTFKVKDTCTTTSTTIKLKDLSANDENQLTKIGDKLVNINISLTNENQNTDNDNSNVIDNETNTANNENNTNNVINVDITNNTKEENEVKIDFEEETTKTSVASKNTTTNKSNTKIPNLGWEKAPIIIAIIAFVVIGIILYLKYYQYNV